MRYRDERVYEKKEANQVSKSGRWHCYGVNALTERGIIRANTTTKRETTPKCLHRVRTRVLPPLVS